MQGGNGGGGELVAICGWECSTSPGSQKNCKLLHARFGVSLGDFQRVDSLSKNCKLLFKNLQLLDQFVIEFIKFSKCLGFITAEI